MINLRIRLACLVTLGLGAAGHSFAAPGPAPKSAADLVVTGGAVYTEDTAQPWAEAVAIRDGKFVAVGTSAAVSGFVGPHTQVIRLQGRMLMPGLIDDHVHAVDGAMGELYDCLFSTTAPLAEVKSALEACVKKAPPGAWISGGYWASDLLTHSNLASPRQWLDAIVGDHPTLLADDTGHNIWANSAALQRAGISAASPDPTGGQFLRESDGTPNGMALETAANFMLSKAAARTAEQYQRSVLYAQDLAHRFGITGLKEADAAEPTVAAYAAVDHQHQLKLYVATSISTLAMQAKPDSPLDFDTIDRIRDSYRSNLVDTRFVKIFLDGVPTTARTAAMVDPYLPDAQGKVVRGDFHVSPEVLDADVTELDRRGYTVKMHAAGDRAIHEGLDAIAAARRTNPGSHLHHELAHAGFIIPDDLQRFAQLGATAELSPVIWYPSPIIDALADALGERAQHYWPVRTLIADNAPLAAGSDWPSVVPSMDPWGGIQALVNRSDPYKPSSKTLWPEQAITLAQALRIYTLDGARALRREQDTGSIVVGKSADFIVLDRNLFKIAPTDITKSHVDLTYFQGQRVYQRSSKNRPATAH